MKVTSPQLPTIRDQLPGRRSLSFYYYCSLFLFLSIASAPKTIVVVDASPIVKHQERNNNNNQSPYRFEPSYGDQSWIFETINLPGAWKLGYTGRGVKIRINDEDWESGHKEWKPKRLIKDNKNALDDYSCGATNNTLAEGKFRDSDNKNKFLNHGAAVTSILAADGSNDFCGVGIAPETELSFCHFRKDTDASVLKYDAVDNMNFFYISVNAFAQEGCKPRTSMFGEAVNEQTIATGNGDRNRQRRRRKNRHGRQHRQQQDQSDRILNEQEIGGCPFVNFYYDEYNPGDDPCKVCTTSDFKSVRDSNNENARNNFGGLQDQSVNLEESRSGSFTGAGVSNVCAESVRTYCLRNFRKDEALCTDWIDVLNGNKPCDFQTSVGHSVAKALEKGVKDGRFGRGIIYIFAAGNSYGYGDNSNFQSYAKSRYAMTVGAVKVTEVQGDSTDGETNTILKPSHASYSTGGSSIFVVAPGGDYDTPKYQHIGAGGTEGNGDSCVTIGTGTSFAAPVVGGVVALMLEANPGLTWRDVRYIIAKTSNPIDNDDSNDYTFGLNSAGVGYSDLYGFGLIDAAEAVAMAEDWKIKDVHVPPELGVTASSGPVNLQIVDDPTATATSAIMVNPNLNSQTEDDALESVSVYLKLHYPNIGQLRITLTSPLGTTSLLSPGGRSHHNQLEDDEWLEFLTLRSWGEVPYGEWKLSITDTKPGNGGVTCFNRPIYVAPEFADLDLPLTCMEFKSSGFCSNGSMNDDLVNEQQELYQKLLDEGSGDGVVSAKESCCECGGGIKFGDDEFFTGQLKEWKLILGDGTPITGTNRIANYDPFLPEVTSFEFMRCRGETVYGHKLDCCNGLEDICDLRVNEVLFATLHNVLNRFDSGNYVVLNKELEIERALEAGYRAFELDVCNCAGDFYFCYGNCNEAPRRDVVDTIAHFKEFLDLNPTEVVVFFFQLQSNVGREVNLNEFYFDLMQIRGLTNMIYTHDSPSSTWPTLRQLTDRNYDKRIIMFHKNGPNCNEDPGACPNQLLYYKDYVSDNTDREFRHPFEIEDRESSCALQRPDNYNENTLVGLSNYVSPANFKEYGKVNAKKHAEQLNQYYAIKDYVDTCSDIQGTDINFVYNDWWGIGELIRLTQDHNSARALGDWYIPPTPAPTYNDEITEAPTFFPTFLPTFDVTMFQPTISPQPSNAPSDRPTQTIDPCSVFDGNCKGCKKNNEECLWCVSSNTCYDRGVFENIFDLDDEVIPCAGEDILDSFDTTCKAPSRDQSSVYDDDFEISDSSDSNETSTEDEVDEVIETPSPTTNQPVEPPTLPPVFVPLSPPTAVESSKNIFNKWFGGGSSSASTSLTILPCVTTIFISMALILLNFKE